MDPGGMTGAPLGSAVKVDSDTGTATAGELDGVLFTPVSEADGEEVGAPV